MMKTLVSWIATIALTGVAAAAPPDMMLPAYRAEHAAMGALGSVGDSQMRVLMDSWFAEFQKVQPRVIKGLRWEHSSDAAAFGALMFEVADLAPLARDVLPSEVAPYAHQFAGDMMKAPLLIRVAGDAAAPVNIAINKRPGSPLRPAVKEFLLFALSREGQELVSRLTAFKSLSPTDAEIERRKLDGFLPVLDPALDPYRAGAEVEGAIDSVGSDGMKTLMDRWMAEFRRLQPGVHKGERWEHLGTLNGFHALIGGHTDLAPMGRELWPSEQGIYERTHHHAAFELRVARGGFNTPQRTTAQAIFVPAGNPLHRITLAQAAALFGRDATITRWGQLGLTGEWAERPITIHMPPRVAPNAMWMQAELLHGRPWHAAAQERSIADTAQVLANDIGGIGFGGFEEGGPGLKALAVAATDTGPFVEGNADNASSGRYPLTRYMYIRLNRRPGEALAPQVKEFLRYVLSRDGQEPILYSGYFPLTAAEARAELAKLE